MRLESPLQSPLPTATHGLLVQDNRRVLILKILAVNGTDCASDSPIVSHITTGAYSISHICFTQKTGALSLLLKYLRTREQAMYMGGCGRI